MERALRRCEVLKGEVTPPGDKSISHRAAILNSIAEGEARVSHFSPGDDCQATLCCLRALGVRIVDGSGVLGVTGAGKDGLREPADVLNARNSGTTMRLLAGLLAAQPFLSVLTGDESLRSRPMARVVTPLRLMGAGVWGRRRDSLAPLVLQGGRLHGIDYRLPVASAQLKSLILIAGLFAEGSTIVEEPAVSRDHTERLLSEMGVGVKRDGLSVTLRPPSMLSATDVDVPADISAAAYWLVAAAIHPDARVRVRGTGVNPTRSGIIDVLAAMGAKVGKANERVQSGEPVAELEAESSELVGVEVGGALIARVIDEIPLIALAGCFARGTTVIRDVQELRVKETDRIAATVSELSRLGADIQELPDGMVINGVGRLRGAECDSGGDHRLAMTLAIAGLVAEGETVVRNAEAVDISYPAFWSDLDGICTG